MSWVRRQGAPKHTCKFPPLAGNRIGDLWRCSDCYELWRISESCDACHAGYENHGGQHSVGYKWRSAGLWDRIWNHRKGFTVGPETLWPEKQEQTG